MDMESLMAQAQDLQAKINEAQNSLEKMQVKGIGGAGGVVITMSGKYDVLNVAVQPDAMSQGAENMAEFIKAAYIDAKAKADVLIEKVMSNVTDSMND